MGFEGKGMLGIEEYKNEVAVQRGKAAAAKRAEKKARIDEGKGTSMADIIQEECELRRKIGKGRKIAWLQEATAEEVPDVEMTGTEETTASQAAIEATAERFVPARGEREPLKYKVMITEREWKRASLMRRDFVPNPEGTVFINPAMNTKFQILHSKEDAGLVDLEAILKTSAQQLRKATHYSVFNHPFAPEEINALDIAACRTLLPKMITKELDLRTNPIAEISRDALGNFTSANQDEAKTKDEPIKRLTQRAKLFGAMASAASRLKERTEESIYRLKENNGPAADLLKPQKAKKTEEKRAAERKLEDEMDPLAAIFHDMRLDTPSKKEWLELTNASTDWVHAIAEFYRQGYSIMARQTREASRILKETEQRTLEAMFAAQDQIFAFGEHIISPWQIEYLAPGTHRCECSRCANNPTQIINIGEEARYKAMVDEATRQKMEMLRGTAEEEIDIEESADRPETVEDIPLDVIWNYHGSHPIEGFPLRRSATAGPKENLSSCLSWVEALHVAQRLQQDGIDLHLLAEIVSAETQKQEYDADEVEAARTEQLDHGKKRDYHAYMEQRLPDPTLPPPEPAPQGPIVLKWKFVDDFGTWIWQKDKKCYTHFDGSPVDKKYVPAEDPRPSYEGKAMAPPHTVGPAPAGLEWMTEEEERQWFEDRLTDLYMHPMEDLVIDVETINTTGYKREIKTVKARFPTTNQPEYCLESSNTHGGMPITVDARTVNMDDEGNHLPSEWEKLAKSNKYSFTFADMVKLGKKMGQDRVYENDELSDDDEETKTAKARRRQAAHDKYSGKGDRGEAKNAWIRFHTFPEGPFTDKGAQFVKRHKVTKLNGETVMEGDIGFSFNGRGDLLDEDGQILAPLEQVGDWFWRYRESADKRHDVSPYQIQEYFVHRLRVAQAGLEISRELLQEDIEEEEQLATVLNHSLYPPDTLEFREAMAAGYGHAYIRNRETQRIRALQDRRAEREAWIVTADEELPIYEHLAKKEEERLRQYQARLHPER